MTTSGSKITTVQSWADRYRPRKLNEVVGQKSAVAALRGILTTKDVPNALLIAGPYGTGKTTLARMFSRYLNCEKLTACGKCASCLHQPDAHPDITEINGAESRGIDDVRRLIEKARFRPTHNLRVFILDEIHQWTQQGAQAFLKPLESPPPSTVYMLCTTDPQKLPDTILSRCTKILLNLPTKEDVIERLGVIAEDRKMKLPKGLLDACAEASGGHMRDAIGALQQAHMMMRGDEKLDVAKLVAAIAKSGSVEQSMVATKLLLGLYLKKPVVVAKAVFDMKDAIPTMNLAIRMNEYVMAQQLKVSADGVWHTPDNKKFAATVADKVPNLNISMLASAQALLVNVRSEMQNFLVNERSLILARLTAGVL